MKKFLLWFIWCLTCPLLAQEEPAAPGEAESAKGRVAWFVSTSIPEGLENPVSVMSGNDLTEIILSKRSPSEPVKIPADGVVRLVRKMENPEEPEKPKYLTLAQATVAEGVGKALIILVPTAQKPGEPVFLTKVQDLAKFRGGDWLYLNLTNSNVRVDMGKTAIPLKPGETKIFDASSFTESTNVPIRYSFFQDKAQEWKMLSASTVVVQPTRREICIFSWDPRFNRIDYHGITFPVM